MYKFITAAALVTTLGACAGAQTSQNLYRAGEVGVSKPVERCRVLAVRDITIQGDNGRPIGEIVGGVAGGVLGGYAGSGIGGGTGQDVAIVLGSLAGGLLGGTVGGKVGDQVDQRRGLEYSVMLDSGQEITFAQEILPGEQIIPAGATCRVQTDPRGLNRVLPVTGLPTQIQRPVQTRFY